MKIDKNPWWVGQRSLRTPNFSEREMKAMLTGNWDTQTNDKNESLFYTALRKIPNSRSVQFHERILDAMVNMGRAPAYSVKNREKDEVSFALYREVPSIRYHTTNSSVNIMPMITATGMVKFYNISIKSVLEELFEHFYKLDSQQGSGPKVGSLWYCIEGLSAVSSLLTEEHKELTLGTEISLVTKEFGYAVNRVRTQLGGLRINFGNAPARPDYGSNVRDYSNWSNRDTHMWMEMGTEHESVIFPNDRVCASFCRTQDVAKMLDDEIKNLPEIPPLVRMVWPDGQFFVDEGEKLGYPSYPKYEEIRYFPPPQMF
ncbi:hypothetical protein KASHIRA_02430 [Serratia phage vB_SmaM-Kashira]|nr:hypothetical protein KASHIRA_02430 [Serratia phage vB_SmaM-Kashira]